ncbi:MAG: hypothetical protein ACTS27_13200, partial [Phycisphaerales bacterium]
MTAGEVNREDRIVLAILVRRQDPITGGELHDVEVLAANLACIPLCVRPSSAVEELDPFAPWCDNPGRDLADDAIDLVQLAPIDLTLNREMSGHTQEQYHDGGDDEGRHEKEQLEEGATPW